MLWGDASRVTLPQHHRETPANSGSPHPACASKFTAQCHHSSHGRFDAVPFPQNPLSPHRPAAPAHSTQPPSSSAPPPGLQRIITSARPHHVSILKPSHLTHSLSTNPSALFRHTPRSSRSLRRCPPHLHPSPRTRSKAYRSSIRR